MAYYLDLTSTICPQLGVGILSVGTQQVGPAHCTCGAPICFEIHSTPTRGRKVPRIHSVPQRGVSVERQWISGGDLHTHLPFHTKELYGGYSWEREYEAGQHHPVYYSIGCITQTCATRPRWCTIMHICIAIFAVYCIQRQNVSQHIPMDNYVKTCLT